MSEYTKLSQAKLSQITKKKSYVLGTKYNFRKIKIAVIYGFCHNNIRITSHPLDNSSFASVFNKTAKFYSFARVQVTRLKFDSFRKLGRKMNV